MAVCKDCAYDIMQRMDPAYVKYCDKLHKLTKGDGKLVFPKTGTFNIEVLNLVKSRIDSLIGENI